MTPSITPTADTSAQTTPTPEDLLIQGSDYAAFERWRNSGKLPDPPAAQGEQTSSSDPDPSEKPAAESKITPPESDPDDKAAEKTSKRGLDKRFRELTSEIRELREKLAAKEQPAPNARTSGDASPGGEAAKDGKPDPGKFETWSEYQEALVDWKMAEREKAAARAAAEKRDAEAVTKAKATWDERTTEIAKRAEYADFDEVIGSAELPVTPTMQAALFRSAVGPEIAYHLAKHEDEARAIAKLEPIDAILAIGRIEADIKAKAAPAATPKPKVSKAPTPPTPVAGSAPAVRDLSDPELSYADFERQANKRFNRF